MISLLQNRGAERVFQQYAVFTGEEEELGCTSLMYHRIQREDDLPVDQRHRCIPPNQLELKEHLTQPE